MIIFITILLIFPISSSGSFKYDSNSVISDEKITLETKNDIIIELEAVNISNAIYSESEEIDPISINYPKNNIKIIPPHGSTITSLSNESIEIKVKDEITSLNHSETVTLFSAFNFCSSIDGLDEFTVKINTQESQINTFLKTNIENYSIFFGNDEIIKGNGSVPAYLSHTFKKEGTYPIKIQLNDKKGISYYYVQNQSFKLTRGKYIQLWTYENKEEIGAGSIGTISILTLIGIALTETGKYKFLSFLLFMVPLYTRIQKEDVLDQFVRGKIYGYIKGNPGVHYNQIMKNLDVKNGTLSYHLHMLEKTGMIQSRKEGIRYRAFYPSNMRFPDEERYRLTDLQLKILKIIKNKNGINQKEIALLLNEKHQTISYNVKVLQQAELIGIIRKGRKTYLYSKEGLSL